MGFRFRGDGISNRSAATITLTNNTFANNGTAINLSPNSPAPGGGSFDVQYFNNIIANNTLGVTINSNVHILKHGNDALWGNTTNYSGLAADGPGTVKADLMLDNSTVPPGLLPGSPCRGAGSVTEAAATDFYGRARGTSIDIGAVQSSL